MFCCTLLCVRSSIAIILMGKRELVVLPFLSSWCLAMVGRLFLAMPRGCLRFVIVVFPDHTHVLFFYSKNCFSKFFCGLISSFYDHIQMFYHRLRVCVIGEYVHSWISLFHFPII